MLDTTPLKALNRDAAARRAARAVLKYLPVAEVEVLTQDPMVYLGVLADLGRPEGCPVCGDSPEGVGLTVKCRDRHAVCNQCGQPFDQPRGKDCRRRKHPKKVTDAQPA